MKPQPVSCLLTGRLMAILATSCAACAASLQRIELGRGIEAPAAIELLAYEAKTEAIVLREERVVSHTVVGNRAQTTDERQRALFVVNRDGLRHAQVRLCYTNESPILEVEARTILPGGESVAVDPADIIDAFAGRPAVNDDAELRCKVFAFPQVTVGSIVEYRYIRTSKYWRPTIEHVLDTTLPVRLAVFRFRPIGGPFSYEAVGFSAPKRIGRTFTWRSGAIAPEREKSFLPPEWSRRLSVSIAMRRIQAAGSNFFADYDVFCSWPAVVRNAWAQARRATDEMPTALLEGVPADDVTQAAATLWGRVQTGIDDRGANGFLGGFRAATDIFQSRYGDSNERALLLFGALRAKGYKASLVFVPDDDTPEISEDYFNPDRLDNALVLLKGGVTGRDMILDPSCLGCAPGEMVPGHRYRAGLLVDDAKPGWIPDNNSCLDPETKELSVATQHVVLAAYARPISPTQFDAEISFDDGQLVLKEATFVADGAQGAPIRRLFQQHTSERWRKEHFRQHHADQATQDGTVTFEGIDSPHKPLKVSLENVPLNSTRLVYSEDWIVWDLAAIHRGRWMARLNPGRKLPVFFNYAPNYVHRSHFTLPRGYSVVAVPEPSSIRTTTGAFAVTVSRDRSGFVVEERLTIPRRAISMADYGQLLEFLERVQAARAQLFVLKRASIPLQHSTQR